MSPSPFTVLLPNPILNYGAERISHIESASDPCRFGDELTCGVEYDSLAAPPVVAGAEGDLKAATRESPI